MKRARAILTALLLAAVALLPLPGCQGPGRGGMPSLAAVALSVGASVGSYLLIRELD